ncbi:V0D/AC39 family V-type ATPase subunit [Novisyntrophococcus fermenticellae]|uniref:V0D/AC39 family V-type ATPase subunit n=1 Tax=Novisyntrophococcus fermenticellae TaxID=2068655 RepID=UPI001E5BE555|nr:V-type ATPase subunit [Novisyntrophococcus fermenticellae]
MADHSFVYAVARIRSMETKLFSESEIEQLLACRTYENCVSFLTERGWGLSGQALDADSILKCESEKTWKAIRELKVDMSVFDILSFQNLYHNLKAAIKETCTGSPGANIYFSNTSVPKEEMIRIVREKDFKSLPEHMQEAANEALETMLQTRDGQLCDIIIDRALLETIRRTGDVSKDAMIRSYANIIVTLADIRIAVRAAKAGKNRQFLERALSPCDALNLDKLIRAAVSGVEAVCTYLIEEGFSDAVDCLKKSNSAFERWCDNRIIYTIQSQKYQSFSAGPLLAYVLARENEIKTVRMILTGKQNELSEDAIRERVRVMYV